MNNWVAYHGIKVHRATLNVNADDEKITIATGCQINHDGVSSKSFSN